MLLQIVSELNIKRVKPASLSQIDTQIMTTVLDYLTVPVHTAAENGSIRYFTVNTLKWVIVLVFISAKQYLRTVVPPKNASRWLYIAIKSIHMESAGR